MTPPESRRGDLTAERERARRILDRTVVGGNLWSLLRQVLVQGEAIGRDYAAGKYASYEELSRHFDEAARERLNDERLLDAVAALAREHGEGCI